MTMRQIIQRMLSEATGHPESAFSWMLEAVAEKSPEARASLDAELPEQESEAIMQRLRQEKEGILAWFVRQAKTVHEMTPKTRQ